MSSVAVYYYFFFFAIIKLWHNLWNNYAKFRASMEPFWDLKFGEYVEYLMRVSSKYLTSSVLPSLMSSNDAELHVFSRLTLSCAYILYIDSPVLYIYSTRHEQRATGPKLYCAVEFFSVIEALKLVTIEVESHSQTPDDPSLVCNWGAGIDTRCRL